MVILKKLKGSTIMETLVSSILIVSIFIVSSMILNNMFTNSVRNDIKPIKAYLNELEYQFINGKITPPLHEEFKNWDISIQKAKIDRRDAVLFTATNLYSERIFEITRFIK